MIPSDQAGCGHYRITQPGNVIGGYTDLQVTIHMSPDPSYLKEDVDLLVLQRTRMSMVAVPTEELEQNRGRTSRAIDQNAAIIAEANRLGIPIVFDNDDNDIELPSFHGLYKTYQDQEIPQKVRESIQAADAVTTTTPYLANVLSKVSGRDNVYILPNCIQLTDPTWRFPRTKSDTIRIGWAGGSSHAKDLTVLDGVMDEIYRRYGDRVQFVLGGYDTRGTYVWWDTEGNWHERAIEDHESIWVKMSDTLFGNTPKRTHRVMRTLPINQYGFHYSQLDIGVVPLQDIEFNRSKSELKLLEYGAYGVPVVASDVEPYSNAVRDVPGVVPLVPDKSGQVKRWVNELSSLIEDPVYRIEQGRKLYSLIRSRYDADLWALSRLEFYLSVIRGEPKAPDPASTIPNWSNPLVEYEPHAEGVLPW